MKTKSKKSKNSKVAKIKALSKKEKNAVSKKNNAKPITENKSLIDKLKSKFKL